MGQMHTGEWSIEFAERPLDLWFWDNLVFNGKDASHSYLRLKDGNGKVVHELHGLSYDTKTKSILAFSFSPLKRLTNLFNRVSDEKFEPDRLKVFQHDGESKPNQPPKTQTIFAGSREDVMRKWVLAQKEGTLLNQHPFEYSPLNLFGVIIARNCHSVSKALMEAMRLDIPKPIYATPGLQTKMPRLSMSYFNAAMKASVDFLDTQSRRLGELLHFEHSSSFMMEPEPVLVMA